jgi:hypothetical protein
VRVVYEFDSPDEAAGFVKGIDDQARERSECEVCDALGLGQVERANAHPHRLSDVLGVADALADRFERHDADLGKGIDDLT